MKMPIAAGVEFDIQLRVPVGTIVHPVPRYDWSAKNYVCRITIREVVERDFETYKEDDNYWYVILDNSTWKGYLVQKSAAELELVE